MTERSLAEEWQDLLARRPTFRESLSAYEPILEAWARGPAGAIAPLPPDRDRFRERWQRGVPLLAESPPRIPPEAVEDFVGPALEALAAVSVETDALQRFAGAWDRGVVGPADLFPGKGRLGSAAAQEASGLSQEALGFVACAGLRPALQAYFAECRATAPDAPWDLGICPYCGAPPGFADFGEDGQRRLACHVCGAAWGFPRLACPYCGARSARDLVRLQAEAQEEGYVIDACRVCLGYVKGVDRRVRWNAGPALVEDWGSPHLDFVARRDGYWRAVPTLIEAQPPDG